MPRFYGVTEIIILLKEIHTAKTLFSPQFNTFKENSDKVSGTDKNISYETQYLRMLIPKIFLKNMEKFIIRYFFKFPIEMPTFYGVNEIIILLKDVQETQTAKTQLFSSHSKEY
jgi:hypothetical protein